MHVLRKIWAAYAVGIFLLLMALSIPVLIYYMVITPGERALKSNIRFLHHGIARLFLILVGIRLDIQGQEHLQPGQSYLIVSNHRSAVDFIINAVAFPDIFRYLAKYELLRIPFFGWVVRKMCLIVDRRSAMSRARSVVEIKRQLQSGWSVFIYPEGSRNRTGEPLAPFYDGAFRIAIQAGAPLAIQTVLNIETVSASARSVDLWPGTVHIIWEKPVETDHLGPNDIPSLKETVRTSMLRHLESRK